MPVQLRPARALEPVEWPTGEDVAVKRPNTYAAEHWDTVVVKAMGGGDSKTFIAALVAFVALVCPSKTEEQIRQECDEDFLWLVANYARDRMEAAQQFLAQAMGKAKGATDPAPPAPTGTSPAASAEPLAVPCGA